MRRSSFILHKTIGVLKMNQKIDVLIAQCKLKANNCYEFQTNNLK